MMITLAEALAWIETRDQSAVDAWLNRRDAAFDNLFGLDPGARFYPSMAAESQSRARAELGWVGIEPRPVEALLDKIKSGLEIFGIRPGAALPELIPATAWGAHGLKLFQNSNGIYAARSRLGPCAFTDLAVRRADLLKAFPAISAKGANPQGRPPVLACKSREARRGLYRELESGRTTPEAAEDRARALGLEALTPTLDPAHFDPMSETHWTLAMAVAWVAWADLERVRDCLPRWRERHRSWFWREHVDANSESGAKIRGGWFLEQTHKGEAPLLYLSLCEASEASEGAPHNEAQRVTVHEAKRQLWACLAAGKISATTIYKGAPHAIPACEWPHLEAGELGERDALYLRRDAWMGLRYDSDVLLPHADLLRLWPTPTAKKRGRPPTKGAQVEAGIAKLKREGVDVESMSDKALAKALRAKGVKASPRTAGRKKRGA
jgi:hypothetical protein